MDYSIRSVVAGVGDLDGPDPVLGPAIDFARRTGAILHLVHAFELPDLSWDIYARIGYPDRVALERHRAEVLSRLQSLGAEDEIGGRIRYHAIAGPAAPAVRGIARREDADLIIVGATRHRGVSRVLLGTTAQRVLRGAPVPVLVLRKPLPPQLRRVLLTTDLSPFSGGVHEFGLDVLDGIAQQDRPEIRSLLVVRYSAEFPPQIRSDMLEGAAQAELEKFLATRRERNGPVRPTVRLGDPANSIAAEARLWDADLVILGTHERAGPRRWLLGSVAEAALRNTDGNVLVVPAGIDEEERTRGRRRQRQESPPRPAGTPPGEPEREDAAVGAPTLHRGER
jgi:nucleotide-binding universal stress UspA family protein